MNFDRYFTCAGIIKKKSISEAEKNYYEASLNDFLSSINEIKKSIFRIDEKISKKGNPFVKIQMIFTVQNSAVQKSLDILEKKLLTENYNFLSILHMFLIAEVSKFE